MKKRRNPKKENQNLKIAFFFFFSIAILLLFSGIIKCVAIIRESSFDPDHRFTIGVIRNRNTTLYSFAPQSNTIAILSIADDTSVSDVGKLVQIPVDAFVTISQATDNTSVQRMLFSFLVHYRSIKTNLTLFDIIRLLTFARNVDETAITRKTIQKNDESKTIENAIGNRFVDETVSQENISLEILNGTDTSGFGNRIAKLVTHMGGNVVLVSTTEKEKDQSQILFSGTQIPYTIAKLQKILHMPVILHAKKELGDGIIVIGKNAVSGESAILY